MADAGAGIVRIDRGMPELRIRSSFEHRSSDGSDFGSSPGASAQLEPPDRVLTRVQYRLESAPLPWTFSSPLRQWWRHPKANPAS
jgi:hypothetical protein